MGRILKISVEQLAQDENKTELEIITQLQAAATMTSNEELLNDLSELKWDYIN